MSEAQTINVRDLHELSQKEDIVLVDVRTPAEYQALHATCAKHAAGLIGCRADRKLGER